MKHMTIEYPTNAVLLVTDRDPFAGTCETRPFGYITLQPGTYDVEEFQPEELDAGILEGWAILNLPDGNAAELSLWDLQVTEAE
jgi:hypothetical protein